MWQIRAPFWAGPASRSCSGWALLSSPAPPRRGWSTGSTRRSFDGHLESVFDRAQVVAASRCWPARWRRRHRAVTNLGVPYILRGVMLGVTSSSPGGDARHRLYAEARLHAGHRGEDVLEGLDRRRISQSAGPLADARGALQRRCRHLRLLRLPALPARALRRKTAYSIAGLAAAIVAGAQIVGGLDRAVGAPFLLHPHAGDAHQRGAHGPPAGGRGTHDEFVAAILLLAGWCMVFAVSGPMRRRS